LTPRTGRTRRDGLQRQRGATLIEFSLALLLGLLPMVLGILQVAALLVAKNELNLAAFLAAREGAVAGADPAAMHRALARALTPLYVRAARNGTAPAADVAVAYASALADVTALDSLTLLNPTRSDLDRYGTVRGGERVIPNDSIESRPRPVQAANVLTIEVMHCQPLVVPLAGPALIAALRALATDPPQLRCLSAGRAPIAARASVVMQSDVRAAALR